MQSAADIWAWTSGSQQLRSVVDATSMHGHGHAAVIGPALIAHAQ
jgi:hypothetical protein